MMDIWVRICIVSILFDIWNLIRLRELVYSFLLSNRKEQDAKAIHKGQSTIDRFTLSYIQNYAIYPKEYKFYHKFLMIYYYTIVPKNVSILVVNLFIGSYAIVLSVALFVQVCIIGIAIHSNFYHHVSRFDRRYKQNQRKRK